MLGCTCQEGGPVCFARAEIAGASWAAYIPGAKLTRLRRGILARLVPQRLAAAAPLSGWTHFC